MTEPTREQLVRNYFVKTPPPPSYVSPLVLWGAGVVAVLCSSWLVWSSGVQALGPAASAVFLAVVGVSGLALGAVQGVLRWRGYRRDWAGSQPKPSGVQMDDWQAQGMEDAVNTGLRRLDLHFSDADRQHDILVFPGVPELSYAALGEDDNILRFPMYGILVVYLTSWRVSTYECVLEMHTGALVSDSTREFHLQQVDGLETQSNRINLVLHSRSPEADSTTQAPADDDDVDTFQITTQQRIQLIVSGRVAIALTVGLMVDGSWAASSTMDPPATDRLIARLREHLRRHMGGTQPTNRLVAEANPRGALSAPTIDVPPGGLPGE